MDFSVLLVDKALEEIVGHRQTSGVLFGLRRPRGDEQVCYVVARAGSSGEMGLERIGTWSKISVHEPSEGEIALHVDGDHVSILSCNEGRTVAADVTLVPYTTDFQARNHGIIDPSMLSTKKVVICGLGSVGAKVSQDLTRAGVMKFTLIDPERVALANICRCEYDLFDLGQPKPEATRDRMLSINPRAEIICHNNDLRSMPEDVLDDAIGKADLAVMATDNPDAQRVGNGLCYHRAPALYPGVYPQGTGGEIIFTVPSETPCLECVLKNILSQTETRKGTWDYATEGQLKPEPALIADIQNVVTNTTKLALALLSRGEKQSRLNRLIDPGLNVLFICNEVEDDWIFEYPFQTVWASAEFNPACWCRSREMASNG